MQFRILSHAGLEVSCAGRTLVCDPWLIGSSYWRSWWNYPPPDPKMIESVKPDFIYLTHIHWDHFQSASLKKFNPETPVLIPKGNYDRMKRDLASIGFHNVQELGHGESFQLAAGFRLTCYEFFPFLDSAVILEGDDTVLFNVNDCKFMGMPLQQILKKHPKIDFVFRSHSSANGKVCRQLIDQPEEVLDNHEDYVRSFVSFVRATGARYAIPFASNHCHLHEDVFHFNDFVTTPVDVKNYFAKYDIQYPTLKVMLPGDVWSSDTGFAIQPNDFFTNRKEILAAYRQEKMPALQEFAEEEAKAHLPLSAMQKYFKKFASDVPWIFRVFFKGHPVTFVLTAGEKKQIFRVDLYKGDVTEKSEYSDETDRWQIHTSVFILLRCIGRALFGSLEISKRVRYRAFSSEKARLDFFNVLIYAYEYDLFPFSKLFTWRCFSDAVPRWREVVLYLQLVLEIVQAKVARRRVNWDRFLPERPAPAGLLPSPATA